MWVRVIHDVRCLSFTPPPTQVKRVPGSTKDSVDSVYRIIKERYDGQSGEFLGRWTSDFVGRGINLFQIYLFESHLRGICNLHGRDTMIAVLVTFKVSDPVTVIPGNLLLKMFCIQSWPDRRFCAITDQSPPKHVLQ